MSAASRSHSRQETRSRGTTGPVYTNTENANPARLPAAIRAGLWLPWGYGPEPAKASAKPAKIPVTVGEFGIATFVGSNAPEHWTDYDTAARWLAKAGTKVARDGTPIWTPAGLGRLCSSEEPLWVLDLDNCVADGKPDAGAQEFINKAKTYTEISPSGRGLRLAFTGSRPDALGLAEVGMVNGMKIESYDQLSTRFVSFTGNQLGNAKVGTPSKAFTQWFGAGWKCAPKSQQPLTVQADPQVLEVLEAIVRGEVQVPTVPIMVDYTKPGVVCPDTGEVDASEAFAAAVFAAMRQTKDARVMLASAIEATGDDRKQKGKRAVALVGGGTRRVEAAVYEVLRLGAIREAEGEARAAVLGTLEETPQAELAETIKRLVAEYPSALWWATREALKRGLAPALVATLTGQALAEVARVAAWGKR